MSDYGELEDSMKAVTEYKDMKFDTYGEDCLCSYCHSIVNSDDFIHIQGSYFCPRCGLKLSK